MQWPPWSFWNYIDKIHIPPYVMLLPNGVNSASRVTELPFVILPPTKPLTLATKTGSWLILYWTLVKLWFCFYSEKTKANKEWKTIHFICLSQNQYTKFVRIPGMVSSTFKHFWFRETHTDGVKSHQNHNSSQRLYTNSHSCILQ